MKKAKRLFMTIAEGGQCVQLHGVGPENQGKPSKRGVITGFSQASRRRLIKTVNRIDREAAAKYRLFITLTYPGRFPACSREWARHLKVFEQRLQRQYGIQYAIAKLEPQKRGAPHWHLLVLSHDRIEIEWISRAWFEIVGSNDLKHLVSGTQVQTMRDWNGVGAYLSKYIAKAVHGEGLPEYWKGIRWWRQFGTPPIRETVVELTPSEFVLVKRTLGRMLERKMGRRLRAQRATAPRELTVKQGQDGRLRTISKPGGPSGLRWAGITVFASAESGKRIIEWARDLTANRIPGTPSSHAQERGNSEAGSEHSRRDRHHGRAHRRDPVGVCREADPDRPPGTGRSCPPPRA